MRPWWKLPVCVKRRRTRVEKRWVDSLWFILVLLFSMFDVQPYYYIWRSRKMSKMLLLEMCSRTELLYYFFFFALSRLFFLPERENWTHDSNIFFKYCFKMFSVSSWYIPLNYFIYNLVYPSQYSDNAQYARKSLTNKLNVFWKLCCWQLETKVWGSHDRNNFTMLFGWTVNNLQF